MSEGTITRHRGIAGQFSVSATTPNGELTFVGSCYNGPVVMVLPSGLQTFVSEPERFGAFGAEWVKRFLESADA